MKRFVIGPRDLGSNPRMARFLQGLGVMSSVDKDLVSSWEAQQSNIADWRVTNIRTTQNVPILLNWAIKKLKCWDNNSKVVAEELWTEHKLDMQPQV